MSSKHHDSSSEKSDTEDHKKSKKSKKSEVVHIKLQKRSPKQKDSSTTSPHPKAEEIGHHVAKAIKHAKKSRESGERKDWHIKAFKTPKEVLEAIVQASVKKSHWSLDKLLLLGFLAGIYVSFGGIFAIISAGGMPSLDVGIRKIVLGICFSVALMLIVFLGAELFTGNTMFFTVGLLSRQVPLKKLLLNWFCVYFSNFAGCVCGAYFFAHLTGLVEAEPWSSYIKGIAETKVSHDFGVTFLRAIPANWLVCSAIWFAYCAEDVTGKILGCIFPVMAFAASGFEHCIANMFFVTLGLLEGAKGDFWIFLYKNLIPATLGNIFGGGLFLGMLSFYLYGYEPTDKPHLGKKNTETPTERFIEVTCCTY